MIGVGFFPQALATALEAFGFPIASAMSLYDLVFSKWYLINLSPYQFLKFGRHYWLFKILFTKDSNSSSSKSILA